MITLVVLNFPDLLRMIAVAIGRVSTMGGESGSVVPFCDWSWQLHFVVTKIHLADFCFCGVF